MSPLGKMAENHLKVFSPFNWKCLVLPVGLVVALGGIDTLKGDSSIKIIFVSF